MIPTPYTLLVRRYWQSAERDAHGNPLSGHGEPEAMRVHGIAPGASAESVAAGRRADEVVWTIYAPAGATLDARDLVLIGDDEYHLDGDSLDWTRGPWANPAAGVVFELKRKGG